VVIELHRTVQINEVLQQFTLRSHLLSLNRSSLSVVVVGLVVVVVVVVGGGICVFQGFP
jgi:hypothetical protein